MKNTQIARICAHFNLGTPIAQPSPVSGGLIHKMWRVATTGGCFAIKVLNSDIIRRSGERRHYQLSEKIALAVAAHQLPAEPALQYDDDPLYDIDGDVVMVFRWIEGRTLAPHEINAEHAYCIGSVLGQIHALDLNILLQSPTWHRFPEDHWRYLVDRALEADIPWAHDAKIALPDLTAWSELYCRAGRELGNNLVIGHQDLDIKNVLWRDEYSPVLIDWDSAGLINATMELAGVALDWSCATGTLNSANFKAVIEGYRSTGGAIDKLRRDAFYGYVGNNWLTWLEYNMRRSLGEATCDAEEQALGVQETQTTISLLYVLVDTIEDLIEQY